MEHLLQEKLSALKAKNLEKLPENVRSIILEDLQNLIDSGITERAPKKGDTLKNFNLKNHLGKQIQLTSFLEKGPLVIMFYRGGWCPYCNLELQAYQNILPQIIELGANLIAITPELPDASLTTAERHQLEFEVLTDVDSMYAKELGIMFTIPEEIRPIYENFGIDIEKHNGVGKFDVPLASTFVLDTDGTIRFAFVKADYTFRAEPSLILHELQTIVIGAIKK